jgi:hypothetical protein
LLYAAFLLLVGNVINIGADIGANVVGCFVVGSVTCVMMAITSALFARALLSDVSRGGRSVSSAHEQPVGTAYQKTGVLERFEDDTARVPLQTR